MIAFGKKRHRPFLREALEGESSMTMSRPDLRDKRDLAVIVAPPRDLGDDLAAAVGDSGKPGGPLKLPACAFAADVRKRGCRVDAAHLDCVLDGHSHAR